MVTGPRQSVGANAHPQAEHFSVWPRVSLAIEPDPRAAGIIHPPKAVVLLTPSHFTVWAPHDEIAIGYYSHGYLRSCPKLWTCSPDASMSYRRPEMYEPTGIPCPAWRDARLLATDSRGLREQLDAAISKPFLGCA